MPGRTPTPVPKWWIVNGPRRDGPYDEKQLTAYLRSGNLNGSDLAIAVGTAHQKALRDLPEFAPVVQEIAAAAPPPSSSASAAPASLPFKVGEQLSSLRKKLPGLKKEAGERLGSLRDKVSGLKTDGLMARLRGLGKFLFGMMCWLLIEAWAVCVTTGRRTVYLAIYAVDRFKGWCRMGRRRQTDLPRFTPLTRSDVRRIAIGYVLLLASVWYVWPFRHNQPRGSRAVSDHNQSHKAKLGELPGLVGSESQSTEEPAGDIVELVDEVKKAGYESLNLGSLEAYVRFGSADVAKSVSYSDEHISSDQARKFEAWSKTLKPNVYAIGEDVTSADEYDAKRHACYFFCDVPLWLNTQHRAEGTASRVKISHADTSQFWASMKNGTLRRCDPPESGLEIASQGGIVYHPWTAVTTLCVGLPATAAEAERIQNNIARYSVDVVFDQMHYQTMPFEVYYRRDALIRWRWDGEGMERLARTGDTSPPSVLQGRRYTHADERGMVTARLLCVRVHSETGEVVLSATFPGRKVRIP